jgi:hypothetical protein
LDQPVADSLIEKRSVGYYRERKFGTAAFKDVMDPDHVAEPEKRLAAEKNDLMGTSRTGTGEELLGFRGNRSD